MACCKRRVHEPCGDSDGPLKGRQPSARFDDVIENVISRVACLACHRSGTDGSERRSLGARAKKRSSTGALVAWACVVGQVGLAVVGAFLSVALGGRVAFWIVGTDRNLAPEVLVSGTAGVLLAGWVAWVCAAVLRTRERTRQLHEVRNLLEIWAAKLRAESHWRGRGE